MNLKRHEDLALMQTAEGINCFKMLPIDYKTCMIVNMTIIADISLRIQIASGTILRQN